jgi:DNA gyrase subunit A
MYDIPEGRRATKGKSIMNFLSLQEGEKVMSILPVTKDKKAKDYYLMLVTEKGTAKKMSYEHFKDVRRSGIIAIKLDKDDALKTALLVEKGDEIMLVTSQGQSIRFKESDIREMGRAAGGVTGMKIASKDYLVGVDVVKKEFAKDATLLVMSANGLGKKTNLKEYKVQKRGGSGIKTAKITPKTGELIVAKILTTEEELIAMSKKGQVIRTALTGVPSLGRQTQGVSIMKLRAGDGVASITCM